jgi:hypothetical protein
MLVEGMGEIIRVSHVLLVVKANFKGLGQVIVQVDWPFGGGIYHMHGP